MLVNHHRLELSRPLVDWLKTICAQPKIKIQEITPAIAALSGSRDDMRGDPADRLIAATAKTLNLPLVSADHRIRNLSWLVSIW